MIEIISMILAVIGSIGGLLWLIERYRRWRGRKSFWKIYGIEENEKIILVVPTGGKCIDKDLTSQNQPEDFPNIITTIEDSRAKASILRTFLDHGIQLEVKLHSQISDQEKMEHLFLICGPVGNLVSRELLARQDVSFHYKFVKDGIWKICDANGYQVHPEVDLINRDVAIIAKLQNPWSSSERPRYIFFAAGLEGLGTWGAAFTLSQKAEKVIQYLKGQCEVDGNSKFVGVVSVVRQINNPPLTEIIYLKPI